MAHNINNFTSISVLVIGDLIMDVYLKGNSTRLCPEAPVPVVDVNQRIAMPGGAANTACNFSSLGAAVTFCTVAGDDEEGNEMIGHLLNNNISTNCIIKDKHRKTLVKTRVLSGSQLITRFDSGSTQDIREKTEDNLLDHISRLFHKFDMVIVSDYDKGILTKKVISTIARLQGEHKTCLAIDSKRLQAFVPCKPTVVKPNFDEASRLLQLESRPQERAALLMNYGQQLHETLQASVIALTLDEEGALIFEKGKFVYHCKAPCIASPSVSGAGDTFLSAYMLSYRTGNDICTSADIATVAASIAVQKEYTTVCTLAELKTRLEQQVKVISSYDDLKQISDALHAQGKTIVLTNGCFDILHSGHVTYLHCAKKSGDVLIVGINTDGSIKRIKGKSRPVNTLSDRVEVLSALSAVDYVVPFGDDGDDTPKSLVRLIRPHVFAKGGDYARAKLPEGDTVIENGGKIIFLPLIPDHSTTRIIQRISSPSRESKLVNQA